MSHIWHNLEGYDIVLASQSPRRVELLAGLGIEFRQYLIQDIDESYPNDLPTEEVVAYICHSKAKAYKSIVRENSLIITADTVVIVEGEILGKPQDEADARRMLRLLSGRRHKVMTAVTLLTAQGEQSFIDEAWVYFDTLDEDDMNYYLDQYKPYDKAGSYGIQEWIGYRAIERIEGSFYTIMGLPVQALAKVLKAIPTL